MRTQITQNIARENGNSVEGAEDEGKQKQYEPFPLPANPPTLLNFLDSIFFCNSTF